jgi:methyl-accepting chemotaxis protein
VQRMSSLHGQSRRIAEIVGLIDGIAFQTNILALNASVEAARDGEAGRSFAVVAQEVRALAQRCAAAAGDIKSIVAASTDDIESGTRLANRAGDQVKGTVAEANSVATAMHDLRAAADQQSQAVQQTSTASEQLATATQSNAALVEEISAATTELAAASGQLNEMVARFKLGTA